ncbi:MAG: SIMPL domain-containing protein [Novosphingobium sp.]|nr:SIMPL domain-containing protein [Novosphingobium sp.]MCP5403088.1 SIMPL domain-containing protein [Novosphingobium sp.]
MKRLSLAPALAALSLCALAAPLPALAQDGSSGPVVAAGHSMLTVSAEGRSSREPDLAVFTAGVATTGKTAGEALSENSVAMNRVIQALKRAGIADRDIQTSNLSLNPVYGNRTRTANTLEEQMPPILGYRANNTVTVKQRKLEQFGRVIDTLVSAGANQVNGPNFQIDEPDSAMDEARTQAVGKARERASLYARAAGLRVVRILTISEGGSYSPRPPVMYARAAMDASESAPTPVAAGEVEVQANVTVSFELAP